MVHTSRVDRPQNLATKWHNNIHLWALTHHGRRTRSICNYIENRDHAARFPSSHVNTHKTIRHIHKRIRILYRASNDIFISRDAPCVKCETLFREPILGRNLMHIYNSANIRARLIIGFVVSPRPWALRARRSAPEAQEQRGSGLWCVGLAGHDP